MVLSLVPKLFILKLLVEGYVRDVFSMVMNSSQGYHLSEEEILKENEIVELCKNNPDYFTAIFERYFDPLYSFVYKRVSDFDVCGELTQHILSKCLQNIHKYKFRGLPFSSWMYRIAINEINQYYREKKSEERVVRLEESHANELQSELEIEESVQDAGEILSILFCEIKYEEITFLELRFYEKKSFKEMGEILGLSEVNAKVKTYRILKKLKKIAESKNIKSNLV